MTNVVQSREWSGGVELPQKTDLACVGILWGRISFPWRFEKSPGTSVGANKSPRLSHQVEGQ